MTATLPFWRRIRRRMYYLLAMVVMLAARVAPERIGRGVFRGLARLALRIRGDERRIARANLDLVLPGLEAGQRRRLLARATDLLGENLFDALTVEKRAERDFADVADDGVLETIEALRAEGRGVLILTGHFGCWELLGAWLAHGLGGLTVVTGTVHNRPVARLLARRRRRFGMLPVPRQGDLRPLLRTLQAGGVVAVLMDQATSVENAAVPFCGRPAPTPTGFGRLALRYGVPVVPVAIAREGRGHRVVHLPPLRPPRGPRRGVSEEETIAWLRRCNDSLETMLRRNPAEWVWFHRRWPDGMDED